MQFTCLRWTILQGKSQQWPHKTQQYMGESVTVWWVLANKEQYYQNQRKLKEKSVSKLGRGLDGPYADTERIWNVLKYLIFLISDFWNMNLRRLIEDLLRDNFSLWSPPSSLNLWITAVFPVIKWKELIIEWYVIQVWFLLGKWHWKYRGFLLQSCW